ncbi:precorrin-2 C(20)-methyltransferase [Acetitomaculum ruminis]|nr:precorrin-2 C(20)-methyltransferase [Acetitomaculum ruminis]
MATKLFGVGVGPGDPELLTLKALRVINECEVIAIPTKDIKTSVAYKIVKQVKEDLDDKEMLPVDMPMTKDKEKLNQYHNEAAQKIIEYLKSGKNVAFLTLGDPTIYSTYIYVHKLVNKAGYETEIISGITSFCAVSAKFDMGLVEKAQPLHVIPSSYGIEDALKLPGTKVLMKAGKKLPLVKEALKKSGAKGMMIENCGMPDEKIYNNIDEINEAAGYYSLIIVKDNDKEEE